MNKLSPKQIVEKWVSFFNDANIEKLLNLYANDAVNHQVALEPIYGKDAIRQMFTDEFAAEDMVCLVENIFEDGDWAILEWKDPNGLRGCGFFKIKGEKIILQRGYWDKLSFERMYHTNH